MDNLYILTDRWEDDCGIYDYRIYVLDSMEKAQKLKNYLIAVYDEFFSYINPDEVIDTETEWSYSGEDRWGELLILKTDIQTDAKKVWIIEENYYVDDGIHDLEVDCVISREDAIKKMISLVVEAEGKRCNITNRETQITEDDVSWSFKDEFIFDEIKMREVDINEYLGF